MSNFINAKIDVTLIEKARLFHGKKANKAGKMPQYLDIVLIPTPDARYEQTHMIVQSITREERDAGLRGTILGNATERDAFPAPHHSHTTQPPAHHADTGEAFPNDTDTDTDVPF